MFLSPNLYGTYLLEFINMKGISEFEKTKILKSLDYFNFNVRDKILDLNVLAVKCITAHKVLNLNS